MNNSISKIKIKILTWIANKIVVQGFSHKNNITTYYEIIAEASRNEFNEDTKESVDAFLTECHKESLK